MSEEYDIVSFNGTRIIDGWIELAKGNKTLEQLQGEFRRKWGRYLLTAFPLLREGESQEQLLERGELYQRPHVELYTVASTYQDVRPKISAEANISHITFMEDAKLAGFRIEAVTSIDMSAPLYRRILRREPRRTEHTFVLITPPRQAPQK